MNKRQPSMKRWNPLLGEWVIIAPVTAGRPWSGAVVTPERNNQPVFDPDCYLCPGVQRAGGEINPDYKDIYTFDNDFPSLSMEYATDELTIINPQDVPALGICRVMCFSPRHNITLPEMAVEDISKILNAFCIEFKEISSIPEIQNVMIFENRGKVIGVSNSHPHGQIYVTDFVPRIPWTMYSNAKQFMDEKKKCLFCTVMEEEIHDEIRIVCQNDYFVSYVPYFARHSYEIHIIPRRHVRYITELTNAERTSLAELYKEVLVRYDNFFQIPTPNITIFQNAPCGNGINPEPYHFHIEFYPPLRSPEKLKYMAGFESGGGNIINPSQPEESAKSLRNVSTIHYAKMT
jgi:UDPglucose--hexose-1-phosphate uridylyltransferase